MRPPRGRRRGCRGTRCRADEAPTSRTAGGCCGRLCSLPPRRCPSAGTRPPEPPAVEERAQAPAAADRVDDAPANCSTSEPAASDSVERATLQATHEVRSPPAHCIAAGCVPEGWRPKTSWRPRRPGVGFALARRPARTGHRTAGPRIRPQRRSTRPRGQRVRCNHRTKEDPGRAGLAVCGGHRHLGHVAGFGVPSDAFARYHRLKGNDVLMVSGTDEHGTPVMVAADREGKSVR